MSEMIEKVSKAIEGVIDLCPAVDASPSRIREIRSQMIARAAIEAMRTASLPMLKAGARELGAKHSAADACWVTMIDAALAP